MTAEILTDAVNTIDLLQSIYFDQEFEFQHTEDETFYSKLHACWETDTWTSFSNLPSNLEFTIKAPIEIPDDEEIQLHLVFNGSISLTNITDYQLSLPSASNFWLSREEYDSLVNMLNEIQVDDDADRSTWIIEKMQQLQTEAVPFAVSYLEKSKKQNMVRDDGPVRFLREWIWFPMIYTREKRGDIIAWAPKYGITGILVPGKPGMMGLEGTEKNVVRFINDIKTISWASLPASHRKMSSKWKQFVDCNNTQELNQARLFNDMTELKFDIHGPFGNRNSLSLLQAWMQEKGCGEAFGHLFENEH
ncbi:hypothetical protein EDC94DRAFT_606886 [Helicostylum pulchrum]|uniref:Small nuclear ribonucleoprotein Prp3 C-terminal domain-containing protein n=1 Tax=Helicostylum pulchrum TaxID=562976 RepID=A0ABP9XJ23_9FUNG|nr:hypothetical protein EDC94DRAFT_606886 [Helicostylum pulchrum]